jgi:hypothetical protein
MEKSMFKFLKTDKPVETTEAPFSLVCHVARRNPINIQNQTARLNHRLRQERKGN